MSLRTPLGKVLGMGSAKDGTGRWWAERMSSVALIPLTLWFVIGLVTLPDLGYDTVRTWLAAPAHGLLAVLLVAVLAHHSDLGSNVIVEDYVHDPAVRLLLTVLLRFAYVLVAGASILAILRVDFAAG